jgi:acyl transferase domain-containing protein
LALANLWAEYGVKPQVVIGHSLGEYAALVIAGVISAADAIRLVGARGQLLQARCTAGSQAMLSVRASVADISTVARQHSYEISCINGKADTVISIPREHLGALSQTLTQAGLKCMELDLPYAFHSEQMDPVLDDFEALARHITFHLPKMPIISPLLKGCIFDAKSISASYLCRACREPVDFVAAIENAQQMSFINDKNVWIDIGPHPLTASFIKNVRPEATVITTIRRSEDDLANVTKACAKLHSLGVYVNWNAYFKPFESAHNVLHLPKYRWNEKDYWIQYTGDWTLSKAFAGKKAPVVAPRSTLRSPYIQDVIEEDLTSSVATLKAISNLAHPDFTATLNGHKMNGHGVVATVSPATYVSGSHTNTRSASSWMSP